MVTKLQSLTSFWKDFSLPTVQAELDDVATDITSRQDDSDRSKRVLIEQMRDFKKNQDEVTRAAVAPLIKSFQNEVDSLAKRAKAAEKAFFDVYKRLADAADPVPVLEHAIESQKGLGKVQDMEIEVKQLKETISDYNKEIQEYKSKEKKLQELQTKVDAYDKNIDETLNQKIKDVSEQMLEDYNEKLRAIEDEKIAIEMKNEDLEAKLQSVQHQLKDTQRELFELQDGKEETKAAKSEEAELLLNDLEVSHQRATAAEKEAEMLRDKIESMKQQATFEKESNPKEDTNAPDLSRELAAKEREVQHLLTDLQKLKAEAKRETEDLNKAFQDRSLALDQANKAIQALESKLEAQTDYESIKKDLTILKSMEFPNESPDDSTRPLEVLILERSKTLQSENTNLRVEKDKLSEEMFVTKRALSDRDREIERQQVLIAELENHVEQLQQLSNSNRGEAEGRSSADILVDLTGGSRESSLTPIDQDSESSKALLPIVQAQRERFRQRNEELEEEQSKLVQQISLLQTEVKDLQTDNVKLYEKIQYLQGYGHRRSAPSSSSDSSTVIPVESRYKSQYEQKMDPFSTFSAQERQRRYGQLNVFEKIILSFVRFMLANKVARLFVFAYSVLLHMLVFMVLMKMAYSDAQRREEAAEWHDRFVQHMADEHGHTDLT